MAQETSGTEPASLLGVNREFDRAWWMKMSVQCRGESLSSLHLLTSAARVWFNFTDSFESMIAERQEEIWQGTRGERLGTISDEDKSTAGEGSVPVDGQAQKARHRRPYLALHIRGGDKLLENGYVQGPYQASQVRRMLLEVSEAEHHLLFRSSSSQDDDDGSHGGDHVESLKPLVFVASDDCDILDELLDDGGLQSSFELVGAPCVRSGGHVQIQFNKKQPSCEEKSVLKKKKKED